MVREMSGSFQDVNAYNVLRPHFYNPHRQTATGGTVFADGSGLLGRGNLGATANGAQSIRPNHQESDSREPINPPVNPSCFPSETPNLFNLAEQ